jgi:sterol desaturase/sphingolipid hydroxylase (fatty acid hydroxylase superfamily)
MRVLTIVGSFLTSLAGFLLFGVLLNFCRSRHKGEVFRLWKAVRSVFPPEAYRHGSSWIDYVNFVVNYLFLAGLLFSIFTISGEQVRTLLLHSFGTPALRLARGWIATGTQFVVIALATDFGGFLQHYLMHKVPFLWQIHRAHHSAEVLTPFSTSRAHPLEILEQALILPVLPGIATGVLLYFSGTPLNTTAMSMVAAWIFFRGFMENFRHSSVWVSYGWRLNHVFYSPAMHQIHHSSLPQHFDKNMGDILSVWDWMFGTLHVPKGPEAIPFGIGLAQRGQNNPHSSLRDFFIEPAVQAARCLLRRQESRQS